MDDVKITDFNHSKMCFQYVGAVMVLDALEKLRKDFPKLAGVGLAVATATAEVADMRTQMLSKNILLAVKNGFDSDKEMLTMSVKKDAIYLSASTDTEAEEA